MAGHVCPGCQLHYWQPQAMPPVPSSQASQPFAQVCAVIHFTVAEWHAWYQLMAPAGSPEGTVAAVPAAETTQRSNYAAVKADCSGGDQDLGTSQEQWHEATPRQQVGSAKQQDWLRQQDRELTAKPTAHAPAQYEQHQVEEENDTDDVATDESAQSQPNDAEELLGSDHRYAPVSAFLSEDPTKHFEECYHGLLKFSVVSKSEEVPA